MTEPNSKPIRLARAALTAGIDDQWGKASRYVQRINDECGPDFLPHVLVFWIDTFTDHATDGARIEGIGRISGMDYETGARIFELPPRIRWAQDLIKARAELNEPAFIACIHEFSAIDSPQERGSFVGAVLETAALSIRAMPRGYAVMGRGA